MRQFLDVGAGLPTADNTHQIAQRVAPDARVVYVDKDPYVLEQGQKAGVDYLGGDLEDPDGILAIAAREFDADRPLALVLNGVLGHLSQAPAIVTHLVSGLPRGSYLSISDGVRVPGAEALNEAQDNYNESGAVPYILRSPTEFAAFFTGLDLVPPGVVPCPLWRPEPGALPGNADQYGGVGRKP